MVPSAPQRAAPGLQPRRKQVAQQPQMSDITVPLQIDGQSFILEINDIQNIEVIDLDSSSQTTQKKGNILDQIN